MLVPSRHGSSEAYRYGFQGQEKDDEIKGGEGNSLNYTFRMHDPRVGRFFARDPLEKYYAEQTPYQFSSNAPIHAKELEGMETSFDLRFNNRERRLLAGEITEDQFRAENNSEAFGGLLGVGIVLTAYTGGRALPLLRGLFWRAAIFTANPSNQTIAVGLAGTVAAVFDPDPTSNYPGVGDDFVRGFKHVFTNSRTGKMINYFVAETGSKFETEAEREIAMKLLGEGKSVILKAESKAEGIKSADFIVNSVLTEFKEISKIKSDDIGKSIKTTIEKAIKNQSSNVIIDVSKQKGATKELIKNVFERFAGNNKSKEYSVRVIGDGFDNTITNKPKK
jgi:RHS repeat-associated protein